MKTTTPLLLTVLILLTACMPRTQVCSNTECFNVIIAENQEERMKGLMFVENMPEDEGMIFVFDNEATHAFWMKNTLIPLDMVWLDKDLNVVHIESNVPPCKQEQCPIYEPSRPSLYVLEINAGKAAEAGIQTGTTLKYTR